MDAARIEEILLTHKTPDFFPPGEDWVYPHYGGLSIANLPATIAALLGSDLPGALPPLPEQLWADWMPGLQRVVLVVLDAMGYRMLQGMWARGEGKVFSDVADAGRFFALTSVFPSTTDAALVTPRTGRPPAEHGWLAYEMYLRDYGIAANAILLCPVWSSERDMLVSWGLDPETLVTVPALAEHLAGQGIGTSGTLSTFFTNSGFTKMLYRGMTTIRGHVHASDLWVQLRHLVTEARGRRAYITAYWSGLDTLGHAYGHDTDLWEAEFRSVSHLLEREFLDPLPTKDREGTLLLITADHGQLRVPPEHILTASEDPNLREHLMIPVTGESRAAFVVPRPGRAAAVRDYLESVGPGWFTVVDSSEALESGLMGTPVADETYARAGQLLVLPRGDHALQRARPTTPLLSRHGGLTQDEMLVPLIAARLDA
jgi:predicted AlkP superfamily pyrophosphatase or phosphodiesterase